MRLILENQPVTSRPDGFVWTQTRSGNFTVSSAYKLAQEMKIKELYPEVLMQPSINSIKERVWKITTAPKIRTFIWKALSEALPVVDLISKRGLSIDSRCQVCGLEGESIHHVLFDCDPARQTWALLRIPHPQFGFQNGSIFSNINYLLNVKTSNREVADEKRAWPWVLWFIWKSRNDLLFNGRRWDPEEIKEKAILDAEEWFLAQEVEEETVKKELRSASRPKRRWTPPPQGWLNCNIAFEWNKNSKLLGVAWVVRNHRGVVLLHSRRAFASINSLEDARFETLLWAVESMTSLRYNKVVFSGDFKEMFLALQKPHQWPAIGFQVEEVVRKLRLMEEFQLKHVRIEENRGATIIAQSVTREGRVNSYVAAGPPMWLFELFVNESRLL